MIEIVHSIDLTKNMLNIRPVRPFFKGRLITRTISPDNESISQLRVQTAVMLPTSILKKGKK